MVQLLLLLLLLLRGMSVLMSLLPDQLPIVAK
jgi:hypothetical protein